ncbi:MAG TPA: preprotein translocase subunit SecE [Rhizomicrobium sp.]
MKFFEEVRRETSKVTWPTWKETYLTTIVVFAMVGLTMTFFFLVDLLLSLGEKWVIGAMG